MLFYTHCFRENNTMSFLAFILILLSALLHASWHFMVKQSKPVHALFIPISGANWVFTFIFVLTADYSYFDQPGLLYLYAAGGGVCGVLCNLGLSHAYRLSEVSLAYPLARALPVVFTLLVTAVFGIGRPLTFLTVIAMLVIFAGCLIMPLHGFSNIKRSDYINRSLPGIICAAAGTTGYTVFDSLGVKLFLKSNPQIEVWHASLAYSNLRESFLFTALVFTVLAVPAERRQLSSGIFRSWKPYCAGVFAGTAYALILIAMPFVSNVTFVQAFRQISLPIGMLLGVIFLHEKCPPPKIAGLLLIVTGLVLSVIK